MRGYRSGISSESLLATRRCSRWRSRLASESYATSRSTSLPKRQTLGRSSSRTRSSSASASASSSLRGSARRASSSRSKRPRGKTLARRTSSRACGVSWSMRAATTAWTVAGSIRPGEVGPHAHAGSRCSSRRSIPVISTMKYGFPPACCAMRSASSCERSPGHQGQLRGMREREGLHPERDRVGKAAGPVRTLLQELPAGHAHHHQRHLAGLLGELLDQVEQERVRLVEVLEDEHHGSARREPGEHRQDAAADLGRVVAVLLAPLLAEPQGEPQPPHGSVDLVGFDPAGHDLAEAFEDPLLRSVAFLPDLPVDHLGERPERDLLLERARAAGEDLHPVGQGGEELLHDPALADPRLPQQRHQVGAPALLDAFEGVAEQRHLPQPVHERDRLPRPATGQPDHGPRRDRLVEPLGLDRAHRARTPRSPPSAGGWSRRPGSRRARRPAGAGRRCSPPRRSRGCGRWPCRPPRARCSPRSAPPWASASRAAPAGAPFGPRWPRAARIPRCASSSWRVGTPKTPSTASPMNPSARPPSTVISSVTTPWNAASTSR